METSLEKYKKVLRLVEQRNWREMEEWLHEDFMYIKETALMDREEHVKNLEKEFASKQAINQNELLHEDDDMMEEFGNDFNEDIINANFLLKSYKDE